MADNPSDELEQAITDFAEVEQAVLSGAQAEEAHAALSDDRKAELRRKYPALGQGR